MRKAKAIFLSSLVALLFMLVLTLVFFPGEENSLVYYEHIEKGHSPSETAYLFILVTLFLGFFFSALGRDDGEAVGLFAIPVVFFSLLWVAFATVFPTSLIACIVILLLFAPALAGFGGLGGGGGGNEESARRIPPRTKEREREEINPIFRADSASKIPFSDDMVLISGTSVVGHLTKDFWDKNTLVITDSSGERRGSIKKGVIRDTSGSWIGSMRADSFGNWEIQGDREVRIIKRD